MIMKKRYAPRALDVPALVAAFFSLTLLIAGCRSSGPSSSQVSSPPGPSVPGKKPSAAAPERDPAESRKTIVLRFNLSAENPVHYELRSKMFVSEQTTEAGDALKLDMTSTTTAVQTARRPKDGVFAVEVKFENPKVTVMRNGNSDPTHARLVEDRLRSQVQTYRFDNLGRIQLREGEDIPFEVGLNGIVFPDKPVAVGDTWTHACKLNLVQMVEQGAPVIPAAARFRLVELEERQGTPRAKIQMSVDAAVGEDSQDQTTRYSGSVRLEETAWVQVETGVVESAESTIDIKVSKVQGGTLRTFVRTAEQRMVRKP